MRPAASSAVPLLAVLALAAAACAEAPAPPPNVVLVVLDTMRADVFEAHESPRTYAPYVDRLAREGAVFPRAFSTSSWTAPATASLMTGVYPDRHGVLKGFLAQVRHAGGVEEPAVAEEIELSRISETVETLPTLLGARGYRTFGVATNINIGEEIGFDQGFDRFVREEEWPAGKVAELVQSWHADLEAAQPYFLYLHLNDVHKPWDVRKRWYQEVEGPQEKRNYLSEVGYLDHWLERTIEELPGREGALLVVTTDHGEEFLDHGGMGHHLTLFDEVNRMLLLLHGPRIVPGLREFEVSGIDLAPTLLELVGAPMAAEAADGLSLAPLVLADAAPERVAELEGRLSGRALVAHRWGNGIDLYAVVRDGWKLIKGPLRTRLYDLAADPRESSDLGDLVPERVAELEAVLADYLARDYEVRSARSGVEMSAETLEMLQTLGYVEVEGETGEGSGSGE